MPHYTGPDLSGPTFAEKLLATVRAVLKDRTCPECSMFVNGSERHGISHVFGNDDCHLGRLLKEADDAGV